MAFSVSRGITNEASYLKLVILVVIERNIVRYRTVLESFGEMASPTHLSAAFATFSCLALLSCAGDNAPMCCEAEIVDIHIY